LENFRQYLGKQTINFAQHDERNVTLFYGANGSGKTTLLNAFTWALYGQLTDDVEERERLISDHVWEATAEGGQIPMSVSVEFEHGGSVYLIKRSVDARKQGIEQNLPQSQLRMWRQDTSGAKREEESPKSQVDRILPERLSRFFFVNGERIEHLVRKDAYAEIQNAIKTLLGLETLERALYHLPKVAQKLRRQLKAADGEGGVDALTDAIDDIDRQIDAHTRRRDELKSEEQHLRDEIAVMNARLANVVETKDLHNRRTALELSQQKARIARFEQEKRRDGLVGHEGYMAFLSGLAAQVNATADRHRERGDLPAPFKDTFIADLLEKGTCICDTELAAGSSARAALEKWQARVGQADVDAAWSSLRGVMGTFEERRGSVLGQLRAADVSIATAFQEERELEGQINDLSATLKKIGSDEDHEGLESQRENLLDRLTRTSQQLGSVKDQIESMNAERAQKEREIERLNVKGEANDRIQRRIASVKAVETALTEILRVASDGTRKRLEERIRNIFVPISLKRYEPRLTPEFQLEYWQDLKGGDSIPAPKSTGENLLLSLSFVAAIAAECRDAEDRGALFPGVGGEFPVVMDAAFGNLDDDYRRHIARFLPDMTSQVVVLTSKAQAAGVVEEGLRDRLGKQYVITTHTTKKDLQEVTEKISVAGRDYPYQVVASDWDGAEFTGVKA
jgi:DNA sulfur modification protein DndD